MPANRSWIRGFTAGAENHCRVKQPGTGVVGAALAPEAPLLQLRLTGPYSPRFSTRSLSTRPLTGAAIFAGTSYARPYLNIDSSALIGGGIGIFLAVPEPAIR